MKKLILVGRSECGKTSLIQALKGEPVVYHKTQYVNNFDILIDTPGEYCETRSMGAALAMYTFEAQVVALVTSATEPYSLFSPAVAPLANRPVIGIITKTDSPYADIKSAENWLKLAGCEKVFAVSSKTGDGVWQIMEYLREEGDVMPWEKEQNITSV